MATTLLTVVLAPAALGAIVAGLLFVPADYELSVATGAGFRLRLRWLFGLVRIGERPGRRRHRDHAKGRGVARDARRKTRRRIRPGLALRRLLAIDGLFPRLGRLGRDLARAIGWRRGRIVVRAGTGDPADTGELCGLVCSLTASQPSKRAMHFAFEPDFDEAMFAAEMIAGGRFVPARVIGALGAFALSRPGRRAIKVLAWDARR